MRILTLDVALNCGACFGEIGSKPTLLTERFGREEEGRSMDGVAEATGRAIEWIASLTMAERFDRAVIEAPIPERALGSHTNAWATALKFALIGALGGAIKLRQIPLRFGHVQSVRKFVIGQGNAPSDLAKPAVMKVCRALGWSPANHDEGDAGALWLWACYQVDRARTPSLDPISLGIEPFDFTRSRRAAPKRRIAA